MPTIIRASRIMEVSLFCMVERRGSRYGCNQCKQTARSHVSLKISCIVIFVMLPTVAFFLASAQAVEACTHENVYAHSLEHFLFDSCELLAFFDMIELECEPGGECGS